MMDLVPSENGTGQGRVRQSFVERKNIHPVLFAFLSLVAVFILYQVGGGLITLLVVGGANVTRGNVNLMRLFTMLGQLLLILVPTLFFARLLSSHWQSVFPLRVPSLRESVWGVIGLLSLQRVFEVYTYFQDQIPIPDFVRKLIDPIRQMLEEMMKVLLQSNSVHEFVFVVVVVALVPSIVEELLFRGLIQKSFDLSMSPLASALLAGTIFGLFHLNPFEAIPLIGIGCFLGFLRYRSASVLLPVLMHFLNNLLAVIAVTLKVGDEKIMMSPASDQPGLLIVVVQLLIFGTLFAASVRFYVNSTEGIREESV